jgi:integrase
MSIEITEKVSRNKGKKWFTYEWGKGPGQRKAAGIFTYTKPKDQIQKNHNKEALALLETKKSQMFIEQRSIGTPFIPAHQFKDNFLIYYEEFVERHQRDGNRHLKNSLVQFRLFMKKPRVSPIEITEDLCGLFKTYLVDRFTGKTPADYFRCFKRVIKTATKEGYFRINPGEDVKAKINPSKNLKEFLEADEYLKLINTPQHNHEIRDAFIFCCYTGLRWCDVSTLQWSQIKGDKLVKRVIQKKTGKPVEITLHPVAQTILDNRRKKLADFRFGVIPLKTELRTLIFSLPTRNGANYNIESWVYRAGINKYITWSCARLGFSILLQDANVDQATVALFLGHTTTKYVNETYKRHRPKDQAEHIAKLPNVQWSYN